MSAGTITITAGRPNREGDEKDFSGPDGTYTVTLVAVSDEVTEKSTLADAKGDGTWTYRVWTFAIDGGEYDGQVIDKRVNARSTGPKSKQFGLVAAFVGRTPPVGASIDIQRAPRGAPGAGLDPDERQRLPLRRQGHGAAGAGCGGPLAPAHRLPLRRR